MITRAAAIEEVRRALDGRQLIWFGTRGDDIEAMASLPELAASYSVINSYQGRESVEGYSYEELIGHRVDLDSHDIDDELTTDAMTPFRQSLLRTMAQPSVMFTYRPSVLVNSVCFARRDRCQYAGMFKAHQDAFEHKPWVESSVRALGLPSIPWVYIADEDQLDAIPMLREGPVMLRTSRSSGGTGLTKVDTHEELRNAWPEQAEAYVSVAPFLEGGQPVNVGAVVWDDGVTLHPASVQLIGIDGMTSRPFGYCGNDFAAFGELDRPTQDAIEEATLEVGAWLARHGYRGAFGIDYLIVDGTPLFTEINPRFQGSTKASSRLSVEADLPCVLLDHLAACLGVDCWGSAGLHDLAAHSSPLSNIVVHTPCVNRSQYSITRLKKLVADDPMGLSVDVELSPDHAADHNSTAARVMVRAQTTSDGYTIDEPWSALHAEIDVLEPISP